MEVWESWEAIVTTLKTVLAFLGGLTAIAGSVSIVCKLFAPFIQLKKKVEEHEQKLVDDKEERQELRNAINQVADADKMLCKVLLNLLDHEISGNHVEKLRKVRIQLETFIVDNKFDI